MYTIIAVFNGSKTVLYADSYNEMRRQVAVYTNSNFETLIVLKGKVSMYECNRLLD